MMPDSKTAILDAFSSVASRRYSASTILFMQGEGAHGVFLVREGEVRLVVCNANGEVVFERIHGAGDLLGLPAIFAQTAYSMTAETITEATLSFIARETLMAAMSDNARLGFACLRMLSNEVQSARSAIPNAQSRQLANA